MANSTTSAPRRKSRPIHDKLAAFMAVFFLLACAGLVPVAWQAKRDFRVARVYVQSEAEIIEYLPINSGRETRFGERRNPTVRPSFVFRFTTKSGQTITTRGYDAYGGREAPASDYSGLKAGARAPVWYDPADPQQAVLSRRFNPHFYWVLALPLSLMCFTGLVFRECLRRADPQSRVKGIVKGRRLAWRLPVAASQRAMTGCLGFMMVISALVTAGMWMAAKDYQVPVYQYRWLSSHLGFNMNGRWFVFLAAAALTTVFVWAFLINLRWVVVPEPVVEINSTRLRPGQSTQLYLNQRGPLKAESLKVSLVCEVNGTKGKQDLVKEVVVSARDINLPDNGENTATELSADITIPASARLSCKSVPMSVTPTTSQAGSLNQQPGRQLVSWLIRVERRVSPKMVLQSDFEFVVSHETA